MCVCVRARECVGVCVVLCERERQRERVKVRVCVHIYVCVCLCVCACVCVFVCPCGGERHQPDTSARNSPVANLLVDKPLQIITLPSPQQSLQVAHTSTYIENRTHANYLFRLGGSYVSSFLSASFFACTAKSNQ